MSSEAKVSAYILTRNEASHIVSAIQSVAWADEVIIVDSGSSDNTIALAQDQGARVVQTVFAGFGQTRNFALTTCQYEWIFCLDADERCSEALAAEIKALLKTNPTGAIYVAPRRNNFMGRWIKYSGWYPDYRHPALFRKSALQYTQDQVHESYISQQPTRYLQHDLLHYPYFSLEKMLQKSNHYSTLGVQRLIKKGKKPSLWSALGHASWIFFRQYILQRGLLDGWPGFILALNAFHATFFRYAKYVEQQLLK